MAITQESAVRIIFQALTNLNKERDEGHQVPLEIDTALFGKNAVVDSLGLVSVIVDIEAALSDELGEPVCLTTDEALNQRQSPFADVRALCAYIVRLTEGKA